MMAAAQPFLSGAISKTVNLPNDATVDDIADVYHEGWKLGLKAVALYRDGCKASQPLSTTKEKEKEEAKDEPKLAAEPSRAVAEPTKPREEVVPAPRVAAPVATAATVASPQLAGKIVPHDQRLYGDRVRLPKKRTGFTQEARVGGHKIFLRTGEYEGGKLGEIFIDMHKEGAAFRSMMNCFAMAVSVGLQYGVPLETYVEQFTFTRFEPQGPVEGHPNIKLATSIVDYIFRVLGVEYLQRFDLAHVKPVPATTAEPGDHVVPGASTAAFGPMSEAPSAPSLGYSAEAVVKSAQLSEGTGQAGSLDAQLEEMMGDAPLCDVCGHITVRNGACYRCLNCGNSMGCS
jgi:ribonucleoside-diphosphate reductase alpha chain